MITNDFFIISGVRMYFSALDLGMDEVPVAISTAHDSQVDEKKASVTNTNSSVSRVPYMYSARLKPPGF
jgi:hypothetical protein